MRHLLSFLFIALISANSFGQRELINAGPMPGYAEMKEVMIWLQTKKEAEVQIKYWEKNADGGHHWTNTIQTTKDKAFTAHLIADNVEPGKVYNYTVYVNDQSVEFPYTLEFQTLKLWQWREDPPSFSFQTGSCAYINETKYDRPGKPYGGEFHIYDAMVDKDADFMIWLGDNLYFREVDWNSWTGIIHRYTHDRGIPEWQEFLSSMHHYAIWDDHDYGPDNSDKSWWNKNQTLEAFKLFWANPSYGIGDMEGAITQFQWGDADFFLLDNRYYRDADKFQKPAKSILGAEQLEWLFNSLSYSRSNWKFIVMGGQFLNDAGKSETYTNYGFNEERQEIINFIDKHNIRGVVFISGDRHHTELSKLKTESSTIYDLTVSPLNSGVHTMAADEQNSLRVDGTLVMKRNFAKVSIEGPYKERKLIIEVFDANGQLQWDYEIFHNDF